MIYEYDIIRYMWMDLVFRVNNLETIGRELLKFEEN